MLVEVWAVPHGRAELGNCPWARAERLRLRLRRNPGDSSLALRMTVSSRTIDPHPRGFTVETITPHPDPLPLKGRGGGLGASDSGGGAALTPGYVRRPFQGRVGLARADQSVPLPVWIGPCSRFGLGMSGRLRLRRESRDSSLTLRMTVGCDWPSPDPLR